MQATETPGDYLENRMVAAAEPGSPVADGVIETRILALITAVQEEVKVVGAAAAEIGKN